MARMRKYGESKTTRIMMETVPHVTSGLGLRKFQADGFLLTRVYKFFPTASGRKKCIMLLLCQGERNVHVVTMSGWKESTCYCNWFCATVTTSTRMSRVL